LWLYFYSGFFRPEKRDLKQFLKVAFWSILFVGVLWELYELIIGEARYTAKDYVYDTTLDLIVDLLGAMVGCFYAYLKELKVKN